MRKTFLFAMGAATVLALASGCSNKQGTTEAPVFLTVDLTDQSGLTNINPARTITIPTMIVASHMKDPTSVDTAGFSNVQLNEYTVTYRRADGGTLVPPVQHFAAGFLVPSGGSSTLSDFPVLSQTDVAQTPFNQLYPFNGGIDQQTGSNEIRMFYDVVFYGMTVSGKRVQSETATAIRVFVYE